MWIGRIALLAALVSTAHADPDQVPTQRSPDRVAVAKVLAVAGAAGVAASVGIGLYARHEWDQAFERGACLPDHQCNVDGYRQTRDAASLGNIATGIGLASLAVVGAAAIVYVTAPRERVVVVPVAERHTAGVSVALRF